MVACLDIPPLTSLQYTSLSEWHGAADKQKANVLGMPLPSGSFVGVGPYTAKGATHGDQGRYGVCIREHAKWTVAHYLVRWLCNITHSWLHMCLAMCTAGLAAQCARAGSLTRHHSARQSSASRMHPRSGFSIGYTGPDSWPLGHWSPLSVLTLGRHRQAGLAVHSLTHPRASCPICMAISCATSTSSTIALEQG